MGNSFSFNYKTHSEFGQYTFYYDYETKKMQYIFKYSALPQYGRYIFNYLPFNSILIEKPTIQISKIGRGIEWEDTDINLLAQASDVNTWLDDIGKKLKSLELSGGLYTEDNSGNALYRSDIFDTAVESLTEQLYKSTVLDMNKDTTEHHGTIQQANNLHKDINESKLSSITSQEIQRFNSERLSRRIDISNIESQAIEDRLSTTNYQAVIEDTKSPTDIPNRKIEVVNKLSSDKYLLDRIKTLITVKADNNRLQHTDKTIDKKSQEGWLSDIDRGVYVDDTERRKESVSTRNIFKDKEDSLNITRPIKMTNIEDEQEETSKYEHSIRNATKEKLLEKSTKDGRLLTEDSTIDEVSKWYKDIQQEHSENISINKGSLDIDTDYNEKYTNKKPSSIRTEDDEGYINKGSKDINSIDNESNLNKTSSAIDIKDSTIDITDKREKIIEKEVEEHLNLHKRFWFLDRLGEIDYKILPNRDYDYPAELGIFSNKIEGEYIYDYKESFKELGLYSVTVYSEDLTILAKHTIDSLERYNNTINGVKLRVHITETDDKVYTHECWFEIATSIEDIAYIKIRQPKSSESKNTFIFVATEKFLSENHPIPFGADLGIKEIPVSINIMVDFMNILLLIWGKRYLAFSGMQGTKAIKGFVKLVHQWVTLDTSLEEDSIEDYHRCYRWLRWEGEKIYNKAKLDPNLRGNYWVEETIYEMIDYLEMHHFDKMPEWELGAFKMDEHRDIFNDPNLDIPVVLDKFKGMRKRAIRTNKQYRD